VLFWLTIIRSSHCLFWTSFTVEHPGDWRGTMSDETRAETLQRTQHYLDWANMPNPFRLSEKPILDLPADPAPRDSGSRSTRGQNGNTSATDGAISFRN
jgi:hypothetical protein